MADRFSRLFMLGKEIYSSGSPVIIAAGALLKDSVTDSIVAQLKFQNLFTQPVAAAKIKIRAYDIAGKEITGVDEYQYLDLDVHTGEYWGADKAIIMPDAGTRSFSVEQISVLFSGSSSWETTDFAGSTSLPEGTLLERELTDPELVSQYRMSVNQQAKYVPAQYGEVWRCCCGAINRNQSCHSCRATKETVFSALDVPTLSEKLAKHIADKQAKEAERIADERARTAERKKQQQKLIRATAIVVPVVALGLFFALWLVPNVIRPYSIYSNAHSLAKAGQYDEAIAAFESLGDYRDVPDQIKATQYAKAMAAADEGQYTKAIEELETLGDYQDAAEQIRAIKYQLAIQRAESGNYDDAIELFSKLGDYQDAAEQIMAIKYHLAIKGTESGDYENAAKLFLELGDYQDAKERVEILRDEAFIRFSEDIQSGNFEEAHSALTSSRKLWTSEMKERAEADAEARYSELVASGDVENATRLSEIFQLAPERTYTTAKELMQAGDYDGAYDLLTGISEYKNAEKLIIAIDSIIDGVYSHDNYYYMVVRTSINWESGECRYSVGRWYYSTYSQFSQGELRQTKTSDIGGDLIFEYVDYYRFTVSDDQSKIIVDTIAKYTTEKGKVTETTTWTRLDDKTAAYALRQAQSIGLVSGYYTQSRVF